MPRQAGSCRSCRTLGAACKSRFASLLQGQVGVCSIAVQSKLHAGTARVGCPSVGGQRTAVLRARGSCLRSHRSSIHCWWLARCRCCTAKPHRACCPRCRRRGRAREQAGQCRWHARTRSSKCKLQVLAGLLAGQAARSKQPVRVRHHRHLTLRSSGQPPAGFAHRRLPLTSNVGRHEQGRCV